MACGCGSTNGDGKKICDLVRGKGFDSMPTKIVHTIECSCGKEFQMDTLVQNCPHCGITYAVTPCSSDKKESIASCGENY
ncbi:MAG: hypothetical protein ACRC30_06285 [Clostridium sp.]